MNIVLWIVQIVLAFVFGMAGTMKLMKTKEELALKMGWVDDFSEGTVKFIGIMEISATIGLIIGGILPVFGWATPFAALGLVVLMAGALLTHKKRNEPEMMLLNGALLILSLFVFIGRLFIVPF